MIALRRLLILACTLLLAGHAAAQERKVSLRSLCFQHIGGIKEVYVVSGTPDSPAYLPLRLFTSSYSDALVADITSPEIKFAVRASAEDGTATYKVIASAKPATGNRQVALFLPGNPAADKPYTVRLIDETEAKFPMGSTLVYNLTPANTRITIGEHQAEIKPGGRSLLPLAKKANKLNQTTVRFYLKKDDSWKAVSSTVWKSSDKVRSLALAYLHPRTKKPTIKSFQETPPWRLRQFNDAE